MSHVVTIRDVSLVAHAVSCMGTADLRDAALAAAPHAAPAGSTKEEVARHAAALIVYSEGGDATAHGLPEVTPEMLARLPPAPRPPADVIQVPYFDAPHLDPRGQFAADDALVLDYDRKLAARDTRIAELEAEVAECDELRREVERLSHSALEKARAHLALADELTAEREAHAATQHELQMLRGGLAAAEVARTALEATRDELAGKLAAQAAPAPAPAEAPSKKSR